MDNDTGYRHTTYTTTGAHSFHMWAGNHYSPWWRLHWVYSCHIQGPGLYNGGCPIYTKHGGCQMDSRNSSICKYSQQFKI